MIYDIEASKDRTPRSPRRVVIAAERGKRKITKDIVIKPFMTMRYGGKKTPSREIIGAVYRVNPAS